VLCYQPTDTTPARYLRAALERAGVSVEHRFPTVDLTDLSSDISGVVFVESPYPALEVRGTTAVPVVYWTHHGEHHLDQNLRLARNYRADAVLLAHSWHLGHRFAVPTFRFPFGVPIEMVGVQARWEERPIEVAMVGAGFDGEGERYAVRRSLSRKFTDRYGPDRTVFTAGVTPEKVFSTYARAKIVVDEGGSLHRPVTMRVFEATGSGAALATDPAPGIEQLFDLGSEIVALDPQDPVAVVRNENDMGAIAAAGNSRALGTHSYDHRVDELFQILSKVKKRPIAVLRQRPPRVRLASRFAEIDSIACADREREVWASTLYILWSHSEIRDRQVMVDALVIDDELAVELIGLAHRYVICSAETASSVRRMLGTHGRHFVESSLEGDIVFDFEVPGYILRDSP